MIIDLLKYLVNSFKDVGLCSCREYVASFFGEVGEDFYDLFCSFAWAVDRLREAATNMAMMVDMRKTEVLKRQPFKLVDRIIYIELVVFYLLQKLF